jgi:hypothetical protein
MRECRCKELSLSAENPTTLVRFAVGESLAKRREIAKNTRLRLIFGDPGAMLRSDAVQQQGRRGMLVCIVVSREERMSTGKKALWAIVLATAAALMYASAFYTMTR